MAYLLEKNKHFYIYSRDEHGKQRCMKALGVTSVTEAKAELKKWEVDYGARKSLNPVERSMDSVWNEYLKFLVNSRKSHRTITAAIRAVGPFIKTLDRLSDLTSDRIKTWDYLLQNWTCQAPSGKLKTTRLLSKESRAHRLRMISAFCGWLADESQGYLSESPFKVKIPRQRKDAGRAISDDDVARIFGSWPVGKGPDKEKSDLSKLFFLIKFYAGTRTSEILGGYDEFLDVEYPGLTYENVDREGCILRLPQTKGGVSREVALSKFIIDQIPTGKGPIFYGKIVDSTLGVHLKKACKAAGVTGRFRVHDSRVTSATKWGAEGYNPKELMDQFGWTTESMAIHYTKVATNTRVKHAQTIKF